MPKGLKGFMEGAKEQKVALAKARHAQPGSHLLWRTQLSRQSTP